MGRVCWIVEIECGGMGGLLMEIKFRCVFFFVYREEGSGFRLSEEEGLEFGREWGTRVRIFRG